MHTVNAEVDRPDPDLVRAFESVPSAIVSDVSGRPGVTMDAGLDPISPDPELAGTALTVSASPGDNLVIHKAITMAEPGDVLVVDGDGYTETAFVGELMCASCRAHDLAGVVVDGAVRDRADLAAMDFPVFARAVHPAGPLKAHPGSINVPVSCGGVTVAPGDVVVGDGDGLAVVPADAAEATLERAREKVSDETALRERVEDGEYLYDVGGYASVFESLDVVGPDGSA
jgi:4-hydroxy-4-methyl-2-oxoglutarate aldolase